MGGMFSLESFDRPEVAETGPSEAYQDGYAAGFAAATDVAARAEDGLKNDLVQMLSDMTFTYREAQQDVMQSLAGLIEELVQTVLPVCVGLGTARKIADLIMARYTENLGETISVHVHPSQHEPVTRATTDIAAQVTIIGDATLSPHAAWIGQGGVDIHVDLDGCLADITEIVGFLYQDSQRNSANG